MPREPTASDIADRLDRLPLRPLHLIIALLSALGLFIDIGELSLNAAFATIFDKMSFVPASAMSILLGAVFAGGIIGAPLCGILADSFGRRSALQGSMLLLTICCTAASLAPDAWTLIGLRFLSGVALGAYPPLMTAWLTDILPPSRRAMVILGADALGFLGAPALLFIVYRLDAIPLFGASGWYIEGWRAAIGLGGLIAGICGIAFLLVPESPRWLAVRGRLPEARAALARFEGKTLSVDSRKVSDSTHRPADFANVVTGTSAGLGDLFGTALRTRTIIVLALYALRAVPTVVFPVMMGLVLRHKGLDPSKSLMLVAASSFGGTIGTLCGAIVIDWAERRVILLISGALLIISGLVFTEASESMVLFAACASFITLGAIFGPYLSIYSAEIMPTSVRAQTTSIAWGLTRLVSSLLPVALIPLLAGAGTWAFMSVVLGSIAVSLVIIRAFGPAQPAGHTIV